MSEALERVSALGLERGLYVLRYVTAPSRLAPAIFVRPSPGYENAIVFVSPPGEEANTLSQPLSFVVIRASEAATIQITVRAREGSQSCEAELKLEPLTDRRVSEIFGPDQGAAVSKDHAAPVGKKAAERSPVGLARFTLVAHVAMLGDVKAPPGVWVAGPTAPAAIEGLEIAREGALAGAIEYQVLSAGQRSWTPWASRGQFLGSRGQKRALVGVRLRLLDEASDCSLDVEALFAGARPVLFSGRQIELRGPSGAEALMGLRVNVVQDHPGSQPEVITKKSEPAQAGRVRVFRAPISNVSISQQLATVG